MRRPRRTGCFGCLGQLLALGVVAGAVVLLAIAAFAPWAFYLGGTFHLLPYWQGWGTLHSRAAGDYVLYVYMYPNGSTSLGSNYMSGSAYICTPRRERIRLTLNALMRRGLGTHTDGETITIHMYNNQPLSLGDDRSRRPRIDLRGTWRNPGLVATDVGSISRAFLPDGRVNQGHLPAASDTRSVTLAPGGFSNFKAACAARR